MRRRDDCRAYRGMPADLAGLKPGDLILAIDTIDVSKATNSRVSELLKGVPNTKMVLTIQRPGEKKPGSSRLPVSRSRHLKLLTTGLRMTVSVIFI